MLDRDEECGTVRVEHQAGSFGALHRAKELAEVSALRALGLGGEETVIACKTVSKVKLSSEAAVKVTGVWA